MSDVNQSCVGCQGKRLFEFFQTDHSPVNCGSVSRDRDEARAAKLGEIRLVYCLDCGLVHNRAFDVGLIDFQPGYEVDLTHSKTFHDFQTGVVQRLVSTYRLYGKDILEIGCGGGGFLERICRAGDNRGVGIDPTVTRTGRIATEPGSVRFIRDFFRESHADEIGDFICSLSVFEDIPAPIEFLLMLRTMIGNRQPGIYFEVFNGFRSIDAGEIWSIHYEQCNYFCLESLKNLFRQAGFKVVHSGYCYQQDQYLFIDAIVELGLDMPSPAAPSRQAADDHVDRQPPAAITDFAQRYKQRKDDWRRKLAEFRDKRRRVVLWGSGGKGISFLNAIGATDEVQYVVDINPNRQRAFIPGTAQEIVAPEFLCDFQPELIILTNPIYEQEIRQQVSQMNIECDFDAI